MVFIDHNLQGGGESFIPCTSFQWGSVKTMLWETPSQHMGFWLVSNLTMLRSEGQLQHCGKALMHL